MKIAQTTTLKFASNVPASVGFGGTPPILPAGRKAAIGGGGIITPALAAHVRKQMAAKSRPSTQE